MQTHWFIHAIKTFPVAVKITYGYNHIASTEAQLDRDLYSHEPFGNPRSDIPTDKSRFG